jgi:hypothetical protein
MPSAVPAATSLTVPRASSFRSSAPAASAGDGNTEASYA